ncbi:unnamed protein product [Oreochromis niloticus]|nr:unnamed protein product [Mustela putorius furo]
MSNIIDLAVSVNKSDENGLRAEHFKKIDVNLNEGVQGNAIYLWYKTGDCAAITRIQFSFNKEMAKGLISAGFHKIDKNLNSGSRGDESYLWYKKDTTDYDVPIQKLDVTTEWSDEAQKFKNGWEKLAFDLNHGAGGKPVYLWVERVKPTYICDIDARPASNVDGDLFNKGYIRMDENNTGGKVFIWYRQTTDRKLAIKVLELSVNKDEYDNYQNQDYTPVAQDLQEGSQPNEVFLWYKKEDCSKTPIKIITVINKSAKELYQNVGMDVIEKPFIRGSCACASYLCFLHAE